MENPSMAQLNSAQAAVAATRAAIAAVGYLSLGTAAVLRHVGRVMLLRPDWLRVADSPSSVIWFMSALFLAGQLRWAALGEHSSLGVITGNSMQVVLLAFLLERQHRSSACLCLCFAASVGFDLMASVLIGLGFDANNGALRAVLTAAEWGWYLAVYFSFRKQPGEVQRAGFGRRAASVPAASRAPLEPHDRN